jgi:hypothetical protein
MYQSVQITHFHLNHHTLCKWNKIKHGVPQGLILGPLLFLLHVNDLPKVIENTAIAILLAADTSTLITGPNTTKLQNYVNTVFGQINKWFEANSLSLNLIKSIKLISFNS